MKAVVDFVEKYFWAAFTFLTGSLLLVVLWFYFVCTDFFLKLGESLGTVQPPE
jgi:hypothetical protein